MIPFIYIIILFWCPCGAYPGSLFRCDSGHGAKLATLGSDQQGGQGTKSDSAYNKFHTALSGNLAVYEI